MEIWNRVGKQAYLEKIHPSVLSNLYIAPHKRSAAAASVLLIGSCEELGVPITVHQVNHIKNFLHFSVIESMMVLLTSSIQH